MTHLTVCRVSPLFLTTETRAWMRAVNPASALSSPYRVKMGLPAKPPTH